MSAKGEGAEVAISWPKWFIATIAAVVPAGMAWATWVSFTLVRLEIKLEEVTSVESRLSRMEDEFREHVGDPNLHHAAMLRIRDRIDQNATDIKELKRNGQ